VAKFYAFVVLPASAAADGVVLDEKQRRLYLAAEVNGLGHGGLKSVHELTGVSEATFLRGQEELSLALTLQVQVEFVLIRLLITSF
jgi:hypothetical protein